MVLTLENVKGHLAKEEVIQLSYLYGYKTRIYWEVIKPLTIQLTNGNTILIQKGFVTDLSSVPRWLWSVAPPYGDFLLAALIHDFLYVHRIGNRKDADKEMLLWSNAINPKKTDNTIRYYAVRIFGQSWWDH